MLTFNSTEHNISLKEAIDSVKTIEIKTDKNLQFSGDDRYRIRYASGKYYAVANNNLYSFNDDGEMGVTIHSQIMDKTSPFRIDYFDVDPKTEDIYTIDRMSAKIFKYDKHGKLSNIIEYQSDSMNFFNIIYLGNNTVFLQRLGNTPDHLKGERKKTHIGSTLNLGTKKMIPFYVNGGSPTRDRSNGTSLYATTDGFIYNYYASKEVYKFTNNTLGLKLQMDSPNLISSDIISKLDALTYLESSDLKDKLHNAPEIFGMRYVYEVNNIYFFLYYYNGSQLHWLFYNATKNQYKVVNFKTAYSFHAVNGKPVNPWLDSADKNALLLTAEGEELLENPQLKDNYDPNKSYLVRIYPKYLNQAAWEK
jgi:hypothetical protein